MITQLMKLKYIDELDRKPTLARAILKKYSVNMFSYFWNDLEMRKFNKRMNNFYCVFIFGEQGTAKSGVALAIAQEMFQKNTQIYMSFSDEQLRSSMETSKPKDTFIRDETQKTYGMGSIQLKSNIENYVFQLRERQNNFIFICPENIEPKGFHHYIRTMFFYEELKIVKCGLINPETGRYMGYIWFNLSEFWQNKLWKQYKKLKDKFMENVVKNDYGKFDSLTKAESIIKNKDFNPEDFMDGKGKIIPSFLKDYVYENVGNLTVEQTQMVNRKVIQLLIKSGLEVKGIR